MQNLFQLSNAWCNNNKLDLTSGIQWTGILNLLIKKLESIQILLFRQIGLELKHDGTLSTFISIGNNDLFWIHLRC